MQKWFVSFALACGVSLALAHAASAQVVQVQAQPAIQVQVQVDAIKVEDAVALRVAMPGPGFNNPNRLAQADAIFVGRVVAFEPMDVQASPGAGQPNANYRIAVVQISDPIFGVKKGTQTIRVGFVAPANGDPNVAPPPGGVQILPAIQPVPGGFGGRRPFPGMAQMNLTIGQDGMFVLAKHHKEKFLVGPAYNSFVARQNNANFDSEVKTAKQLAKVMGDPIASLKAEDATDRYLAAAVLIAKYRSPNNPTGKPVKQQQIDAEESKLILKAIAGGDWTPGRFNAGVPNPYDLFNQLGINANDGYRPVNLRNQNDLGQAMQKWLDENNAKYRINQLVVDPNAKPQVQPVPQPGGIRPPGVKIQPLPVRIQPIQGVPVPVQPINRGNVQPQPARDVAPPAVPVPPQRR